MGMKNCAALLVLLTHSSFLVLVTGQLTYEGHLPALNRLYSFTRSRSQDEVGRQLAESLAHVNTHRFFSVLNKLPESRYKHHMTVHDGSAQTSESAAPTGGSSVNVGAQCLTDVMAYVQHLNHTPPAMWALFMADATGKPSAGILSGRFLFLGDFDQCRGIRAHYSPAVSNVEERKFNGQYCLGQYRINFPPVPPEGNYRWALCVPDSCNEKDVLEIGNLILSRSNVTFISFKSMSCNMRHVPWTARGIGVFSMVAVIVFLVLVGTAVDVWFIQMPIWQVSAEVREDLGDHFDEHPTHRPFDAPTRRFRRVWREEEQSEPLILNRNPVRAAENSKSKVSPIVRIFAAFSAWSNVARLLSTKQPPGTLTCLNGIRVISINWVLLAHTVLILSYAGDNLGAYSKKALKRWSFQAIINSSFSVDSFFVLSGLLVTYLTLKDMRRTGGKHNWLKFYVHRYLRITPLYMITMGIYLATLPYLFNGPMYPQKTGFEADPYCKNNWWGNLLYIQNLVKFKPSYCMEWAWYLAVDMQFYAISPLLIIPLFYKPKLGYIIFALFFLMTTLTPFILTETRYYSPGRVANTEFHKPLGDKNYDLYIAPYCRMGPYLAGILCGYVFYSLNDRTLRMPRLLVITGWAAAAATALAVLYGLTSYFGEDEINLHVSAIYNALSRTAWAASLVWVIFACVTGHGGMVNTILSWSAWVPLARLTYAVYLIHCVILMVWVSTTRVPFYINDSTITQVYLGLLLMTYAVAFVFYILFEAPIVGLEKALVKQKLKN